MKLKINESSKTLSQMRPKTAKYVSTTNVSTSRNSKFEMKSLKQIAECKKALKETQKVARKLLQ